jgi:trimeric autotransporter adhesin
LLKPLIAGLLFALCAFPQTGVVRSNSQPLPGATITATQGDRKLTTATDENGRYTFEGITPGEWTVEVELFGFAKSSRTVTVGSTAVNTEWNLELRGPDRLRSPGEGRQAIASQNQTPVQTNNGRSAPGSQRSSQGGPRPAGAPNARPGSFQQVQNIADSQVAAELARSSAPEPSVAPEDSAESFLVNGSLSRGLQTGDPGGPVDDPNRRDQFRGRPGAPDMGGDGAPGAAPPGGGGAFGGGGFGGGRGGGGGGFGGGRGGGGGGFNRGNRRGPGGPGGRDAFFGNRSRRGGNQVRGAASFTLRNSALDAAPYSLNGQDSEKSSYAQSRFSFMVGGPLIIPKLVHAPQTFFFISYFGSRARNPYRSVGTVPTLAERAGDFSFIPSAIYDPQSHSPFAGNQIPLARLNPIAQSLLQYFPLPNQPGFVQNYVFVGSTAQDSDNLSVRLNQSIGKKDRLSLNISTQRRDGNGLQMYGFRDETSGSGWNSDLSWAHTLGARSINNLRWSFNRNVSDTIPFFANGINVAAQLGIAGTSQNPINYGPPNLSFTNYGALTDASPVLIRNQSSAISDGITRTMGSHNLSAGFEFRRIQLNTRTDQNARGTFSFSGLSTSALDDRGSPQPQTGYDLADFLLGLPQSSSIRFGDTNTYFRGSVYSAYTQDDWRLLPNFSLMLGLRYEYFTPLTEKYGRIANLAIAPGFSGVSVVTPDTPGQPSALIKPDRNNFSPRVGFAWKPTQKSKTQIRGGYGIYYNSSIYNQIASRLAGQPPFANTSSISTSLQTPLTLAAGLTQIPVGKTVLNTYAVDESYALGYAQTWTLSVQHELPHSFIVEAGYIGTKGTRLDIQRLPNRAAPGSPLTAEQRRQIGNAVGFTYESAEGDSIYHAAQLRLMRRFRRGMSGSILYTFGKSIDNSSTFGGAGNTVAQDDRNLRAERGLSSFDQRHTINANYILTSPLGTKGETTWFTRLAKDWTLSGGFTYSSGTPLTARVLGNVSDSGGTGAIGSGRADATGLPISGGDFFNLAAFAVPPAGRFGDAARNTIPGPAIMSLNASFGRSFTLAERRRLEFRLESNNFLNHVNISSFGTVVNSLTYGYPLAAAPMRSVQATVRFRF